MPEKKDAISLSYETNFEELDAHEIQPEEYEDAPELTDKMFRQGTLMHGEQEIYSFPKELITLPLSADLFERWVATGPGWYERMAERLRDI